MATASLHPISAGIMTLSLLEKSQMKDRINREHNSNFRAGYVHVHREHLMKTGIRGRKAYCLYCVVIVLLLIALANMAANIALLVMLNWQRTGLELVRATGLTRFLQDTLLQAVIANQINSFQDQGIQIDAHKGQPIVASVENEKSKKPRASYDENRLVMSSLSGDFLGPPGSTNVSSWITRSSAKVSRPKLNYLNTPASVKNKIKSTRLPAKPGFKLPQVKNNPKADPAGTELGLILCVCLPAGRLFAVKSGSRCDQVVPEDNPCKP